MLDLVDISVVDGEATAGITTVADAQEDVDGANIGMKVARKRNTRKRRKKFNTFRSLYPYMYTIGVIINKTTGVKNIKPGT